MFKVAVLMSGVENKDEEWEIKTFFNGSTEGPVVLKTINKDGRFTIEASFFWNISANRKNENVRVEIMQVTHSQPGKKIDRKLVKSIGRDYKVFCDPADHRIIRKIKAVFGRCFYKK